MDENKRTKILAGGLAGVLLVWGLQSVFNRVLMEPIRQLRNRVADAEGTSESLSRQEMQLKIARRNLADWVNVSLPPDPDDAQRLYREWLYEMARQCGFSGPSFEVVPGSRSPQKEFSTITVEIRKAEVTLQDLSRFLYLFDQASLLHRIASMKIDSPGTQGNPRLNVSMTAEGMSVAGTIDRKELLPRTTLKGRLEEGATQLTTNPTEEFPTWDPFEPFLVRIDRELLRVESVSQSGWTVRRGMEGSKPAAHDDRAVVELLPVAWDRKAKSLADYENFVKASLFVIPSPPKTWNPRLSGVSDKTIKPGEEVRFTARAESLNPELGEPQFALNEAAEGMSIDAKSGEFKWTPAATLAAGRYSATVLLTQAGNPNVKLDSKLTITIKPDNAAPQLELPESAIVIIGREFKTTATASDDGPKESLKFSLGNGTPEGLKIDPTSGQLTWNPARTFTPGKYDVEVIVTDSGEGPKTASKKISLDVQDDNAALTLYSGAFGKDGVLEAWFRNKGTGKTVTQKAGERLQVSEIDAEIVSITNRDVTLRDAEGLWKLELGRTVRERKLVEPAATPTPATTPATDPAVQNSGPPTVTSPDSAPEKSDSPVPGPVPATQPQAPDVKPAQTEDAPTGSSPAAPSGERSVEKPVSPPAT